MATGQESLARSHITSYHTNVDYIFGGLGIEVTALVGLSYLLSPMHEVMYHLSPYLMIVFIFTGPFS